MVYRTSGMILPLAFSFFFQETEAILACPSVAIRASLAALDGGAWTAQDSSGCLVLLVLGFAFGFVPVHEGGLASLCC